MQCVIALWILCGKAVVVGLRLFLRSSVYRTP